MKKVDEIRWKGEEKEEKKELLGIRGNQIA